VRAGAAIINDVSGGTLDPAMWRTVAGLPSPVSYKRMFRLMGGV
jgi:dihydropteroate synthase